MVPERFPEARSLSPAELPDFTFGKLFGRIVAPVLLDYLEPNAFDWRPDLVVADAAEFAGHVVAAQLGVPSVTKGFGPLLPERRLASAGDELAPLWQSRGLESRPYGGALDHLYLDIYPPALQGRADHVPRRQLLRPVAYDGLDDRTATTAPLPEGSRTPRPRMSHPLTRFALTGS